MYTKCIKRLLDFVFGILFLIILSPIFLLLLILVKIDQRGKPLFKQPRIGLNKKRFTIYKFKTMTNNIKKDYISRTTKFSRFLNRTGFDELPQLINIIKGDMSFIGPRPFIITEKLPIRPDDKLFEVRPGLSGMAQANGRRKLTHKKRLEYDYYYIDNMNLLLDIKIFFKTFFNIFLKFG